MGLAGEERGVGFPKRELPGTSTICLVRGDSLGPDTGGDMVDFLVLTTDSFQFGQAISMSGTHRRVELHYLLRYAPKDAESFARVGYEDLDNAPTYILKPARCLTSTCQGHGAIEACIPYYVYRAGFRYLLYAHVPEGMILYGRPFQS
jgi:hypothetical protein